MKRCDSTSPPPPLPAGSGERQSVKTRSGLSFTTADRKESVKQLVAASTCALSGCTNGLSYDKATLRIPVTSAAAEATGCPVSFVYLLAPCSKGATIVITFLNHVSNNVSKTGTSMKFDFD